MMKTTAFLTLALGAALLRAATLDEASQSGLSYLGDQPISDQQSFDGTRQIDTPEVVLQLKYDGGELNRIYLAQFRKGPKEWVPSVHARTNLCSDLCYAGLGGDTCGPLCQDLIPVGLKSALQVQGSNLTEQTIGEPRTSVCPTLCEYHLGYPLCNCAAYPQTLGSLDQVDWAAICNAFCVSDRFVLGGCPACDASAPAASAAGVLSSPAAASRALSTAEGWSAWCTLQCGQGRGGAACNCDRAPFQ